MRQVGEQVHSHSEKERMSLVGKVRDRVGNRGGECRLYTSHMCAYVVYICHIYVYVHMSIYTCMCIYDRCMKFTCVRCSVIHDMHRVQSSGSGSPKAVNGRPLHL